jgi:hypothetical protein
MAQYMVVNEHGPEHCDVMEAGIPKLSSKLKGTEFYCTCPGGLHGYFMIREGDSAEEVLALLPDEMKLGSTKALVLEVFKL